MTPTAPTAERYLQLRWLEDLLKSLMPRIEPHRKKLYPNEIKQADALLDVFNACRLAAKPIEAFLPCSNQS